MKNIKVIVTGNYSNIETKKEYCFIENYNEFQHVYKVKGKRLKTIIPNHYLFETSKSLQVTKYGYLGSTNEIEKGFIPSNSLTNYFKKKVYRKREFAEDFLKQQYFENLRKLCFGSLARQEFAFTINYIENFNTIQIAKYLVEQWGNRGTFKTFLKIAKKYKKANVFSYQGQGGFISEKENINY
jgi:hypothetical protein